MIENDERKAEKVFSEEKRFKKPVGEKNTRLDRSLINYRHNKFIKENVMKIDYQNIFINKFSLFERLTRVSRKNFHSYVDNQHKTKVTRKR